MLAPGTACLASRIQIASWQHIKIQFLNSALFSPCHPERCFRLGNGNG